MQKTFRLALLAVLTCLFVGPSTFGQTDEIELTRTVIQAQRQAIVAANLGLTDEEGHPFWLLFRDYRNDLAKTNDRFVKLIKTYAENFDNLSDETASWMVAEFLSIAKVQIATRESWIPRFREVISPMKLARFVQIENKLDAIINYELADATPLVK